MEGLNVGIAFAAGVLSFLSPCVLPLIPSYLSFVGGSSLEQLQTSRRSRLIAFYNTLFFVLGFSIVFVVLGAFVTVALGMLGRLTRIVNLVAGGIVIVLGLNFIFDFWKFLNYEKRVQVGSKPAGFLGSLLVGMAFGAGWAPCVGPILSSILLLAGTGEGASQGIILLFVYSLGLGLPFLATGLFFSTAQNALARMRPHLHTIKIASGLFLVGIGLLIMLGMMQQFNVVLFSASAAVERWEEANPILARWVFGVGFMGLAGLAAWAALRGKPQQDSRRIRPFPLTLTVGLLLLAVLSAAGVINFSSFLSFWFSYQGL
jgi:cytochrome c-type biogenesis protein